MTTENPQAFPKLTGLDPSWSDGDSRNNGEQPNYFHADSADGMSLRDYFAAKVLQGIYSNQREDYAATTREDRAVEAYRAADAMLKARAQ